MRTALGTLPQATLLDLREFAYLAASVASKALSLNDITINDTREIAKIAIHMALDAFNAPSAEHTANMHDKLLTIITSCYLFKQFLPAYFETVMMPLVVDFKHGDHVMTDVACMESDSDTSHPQVTLCCLDTQTHERAPQTLQLNVETQTSTENNGTLAPLALAMQTLQLNAETQTLTTFPYSPTSSFCTDEYTLPATTSMSVRITTNTFLHADLSHIKWASNSPQQQLRMALQLYQPRSRSRYHEP
jgi:hypothetical protein